MEPDFCCDVRWRAGVGYLIGPAARIPAGDLMAAPPEEVARSTWGDLANWALRSVRGEGPRLALGIAVERCAIADVLRVFAAQGVYSSDELEVSRVQGHLRLLYSCWRPEGGHARAPWAICSRCPRPPSAGDSLERVGGTIVVPRFATSLTWRER
jgi:hypothetical protein